MLFFQNLFNECGAFPNKGVTIGLFRKPGFGTHPKQIAAVEKTGVVFLQAPVVFSEGCRIIDSIEP